MVLNILHKIGLTNLTCDQINVYNNINKDFSCDFILIKLLHFLGLTNLSKSDLSKIETYIKSKKTKTIESFNIIIAEDNEAIFDLMNNNIASEKIKVIRAHNGKEAVDLFNENEDTDLILMDVLMPVMDGYEASKIIKSKNKNIPIVALTRWAKDKEMNIFFNDSVSKPISFDILSNKINKILDEAKKEKSCINKK